HGVGVEAGDEPHEAALVNLAGNNRRLTGISPAQGGVAPIEPVAALRLDRAVAAEAAPGEERPDLACEVNLPVWLAARGCAGLAGRGHCGQRERRQEPQGVEEGSHQVESPYRSGSSIAADALDYVPHPGKRA